MPEAHGLGSTFYGISLNEHDECVLVPLARAVRCYPWPMSSASHLSDAAEARFWHGVQTAGRCFMGEADVQIVFKGYGPPATTSTR